MPGPFIFIATNRLKEGKLEREKKRVPGLIDVIQANEPRLIAFNEYAIGQLGFFWALVAVLFARVPGARAWCGAEPVSLLEHVYDGDAPESAEGLRLDRLRRPARRQLQILLAVRRVGNDGRVPRPALGSVAA
jgi:hypothetical protein